MDEQNPETGLVSGYKNAYLNAMRESVTDSTKPKDLLEPALTTRINDREMFVKGIDYSYYYESDSGEPP